MRQEPADRDLERRTFPDAQPTVRLQRRSPF
jgi:hypothetical protein